MKIIAIVQARSSSRRFKNKVILPILDRPMILRLLDRLTKSKRLDDIIIATSTESSDDLLSNIVTNSGYNIYRGELQDVLARYYHCSKAAKADVIVRVTGDCPLIDPVIVDNVIKFHLDSKADYTSNALDPTFPDGFDTEVINYSVLKELHQTMTKAVDREHVTHGLYSTDNHYLISSYRSDFDYSHYRLTVDYKEDFELINILFSHLQTSEYTFTYQQIINFLNSNPQYLLLNKQYSRNEGLQYSKNNEV